MIRKLALAAILFFFSVSATNAAMICSISASDIAFGEYTGASTDTGAIVITCIGTGNANYVVTLTTGLSGSYTLRNMANGAARLSYNLYSQSTLSSIWGDGTGASAVVRGTIRMGNNLVVTMSLPVYGRIPIQAAPAAGGYTDSIQATMTYGGPPANASFQVTAHVSAHCTISATDLNFGSYTQAQLDGQSQIQLTCSNNTPWNVGLDGGRYPGGTVSRRSMSGPGLGQLDYQLYNNPARTVVWGNTIGTDTVPGTGNGLTQTFSVYGRIPSGERVNAGGYTDTITATITY